MSDRTIRLVGSVLLVLALLAACGGDDDDFAAPDADVTAPPDQNDGGNDGGNDEGNDGGNGNEGNDDGRDPAENDPGDADQDGAVIDNCPNVFNADQADDDGDGIGNLCEEFDDISDLSQCGLGEETGVVVATLSGESGDDEEVPTCIALAFFVGDPPPIPEDKILFEFGGVVIVDLTPTEIETLREAGVRVVEVGSFPDLTAADFIERRIKLRPRSALDSVAIDQLSTVDPRVLAEVPDDELAGLPDQTLAAFPDRFWTEAPDSALEAIGERRLAEIDPSILELVPDRFDFTIDEGLVEAPVISSDG